jgi:hypothetical protein
LPAKAGNEIRQQSVVLLRPRSGAKCCQELRIMESKSGRVLLAGILLCGAATCAFAQGTGTGTARSGAANVRPVPGMAIRPNIPGSPGTALGPAQPGVPTRPVIPGSPGNAFGAGTTQSSRPDCLNGSIAVAGC